MMANDDSEYDGGYERVFGVEFKQPNSRNAGLNDESILSDPFYVFSLLVSCVPIIGIMFVVINLSIGFDGRHSNPFCIDEQFWKVGVFGAIGQGIVLSILTIVLLL